MGRPRDIDIFDDTMKEVLSCPEIEEDSIRKIADRLCCILINCGWESMELSDYYSHAIIGPILKIYKD